MDDVTRPRRGRRTPTLTPQHGLEDPAVAAVSELLRSERERASREEPDLVDQADPGCVWLLWFAIGATAAVCRLVGRDEESGRDEIFRRVVGDIFDGTGIRPCADPLGADRRRIELFESAGAAAIEACMRGEKRLGYYLEALRVSSGRDL